VRRVAWCGPLAVVVALLAVTPGVAQAAGSSQPAARGGLDCNGFSPLQKTFRQM
jgi:hypothetical protein